MEEGIYFSFEAFEQFTLVVKEFANGIFLYSNYPLQELDPILPVSIKIHHGFFPYNEAMFLDGYFSFLETKIGYIAYERDDQSLRPVFRVFFIKSSNNWAEAMMEQQKLFLNKRVVREPGNIYWTRTEGPKDRFGFQIDSHESYLVFDFDLNFEKHLENQSSRTNGEKILIKPEKLPFTGMTVAMITLTDSSILYVAIPMFLYEENTNAQEILLIVFYKIRYEVEDYEQINTGSKLIYYPLTSTKVSVNSKLERINEFCFELKKTTEDNRLFFNIKVRVASLHVENFELPQIAGETHQELHYIYDQLNHPVLETFNGVLIKTGPEKKNDLKSKKTTEITKTKKFVLFFFLAVFGLGLLILFANWMKKRYFDTNKKRFKKNV